ATFLTLFKVTKSATGTAVIPTTGTSVPVTAYKVPAAAPQPGTSFKLDTSDTRPTQAVSAIDPAHGSVTALWTQHTVFGGAGAGAISGLTLVATSTAADTGFDCIQLGHCRWGDYAGASPDPASPATGTTGQVWGSSMLSAPGGGSSSSGWTTRNFAIKP